MDDEIEDFFISTHVHRDHDFPEMLSLLVTANYGEETDEPDCVGGHLIASLITTLTGYPDEDHFGLFDSQSGHAVDAYEILTNEKQQARIRQLVGQHVQHEDPEAYLLISDIKVKPECRGNRLALRLMREAVSIFGYYDTLTILKAHPTTNDDTTDDEIRGLTDYYLTDPHLQFKELDREHYAGWLVTRDREPYFIENYGDESFYNKT